MDAAGCAMPSLGRTEPLSGELGKLRRRRRWILTPSAAVRNLRWPMVKWSRPTGRKSLSLPLRLRARSRSGNSDPHVLFVRGESLDRTPSGLVALGSSCESARDASLRVGSALLGNARRTCARPRSPLPVGAGFSGSRVAGRVAPALLGTDYSRLRSARVAVSLNDSGAIVGGSRARRRAGSPPTRTETSKQAF